MTGVVPLSPLRRLSPKAAEGWRAFCAAQGCTHTALAEALGPELARSPQRGTCLRGYGRSSPRPGRSPASGGSGSHPQYKSVVLGERMHEIEHA